MHLRVFREATADQHFVEISSPRLKYEPKLFLPMCPQEDPVLADFNPDTLVQILFMGRRYQVAFLLVERLCPSIQNLLCVGRLEESDSRNVLNNLYDILAWD